MKKAIQFLFGFGGLMVASVASAGIITTNVDLLLPSSSYLNLDLDGDAITDIGLAEDCCEPDNSFVYLLGFSTEVVRDWASPGDLINAALSWEGAISGYMPLGGQVVGLNYIPARYTSIGNFFGYITLDYDGNDLRVVSYTYEDTGRSLTINGGSSVPEPASLALLGLGLAGIGFCRKNRKSA